MTVAEPESSSRVEKFLEQATDRGAEWFVERKRPEAVFSDDQLSLAGARAAVQAFPGWKVSAAQPGFERRFEVPSESDAVGLLHYIDAVTRGEPVVCDVSVHGRDAGGPTELSVAIQGRPGWGVAVRALDLVAQVGRALDGEEEPESPVTSGMLETFSLEHPEWWPKDDGIGRRFQLASRSAAYRFAGRVLALARFHPQRPRCSVEIQRCEVVVWLRSRELPTSSEGALDVALIAERLARPADPPEGWDDGECGPTEGR